MPISDVFTLANGTTILVGSLAAAKGTLTRVEGRKCRLFQDDVMVCDVEITGVSQVDSTERDDLLPLCVNTSSPLPSGPTFGEWTLKTLD